MFTLSKEQLSSYGSLSTKNISLRMSEYKMVDSKTVIGQVQELQVILHEIYAEGMVLSESFQVAVIIENCLLL